MAGKFDRFVSSDVCGHPYFKEEEVLLEHRPSIIIVTLAAAAADTLTHRRLHLLALLRQTMGTVNCSA